MDNSKKTKQLEDFFALLAEGKEQQFFSKDTLEYAEFLSGEKMEIIDETPSVKEEKVIVEQPVVKEQITEEPIVKNLEEINKYLKKSSKGSIAALPLPNDPKYEIVGIAKKLEHLENWAYRLSMQSPGSGEVWFKRLNDVVSETMEPVNNNWVLEYDAASKKVQFTDKIGPIQQVHFDNNHVHDEVRLDGTLCWDPEDKTLNLTHPGGVTQQIGQESYMLVKNMTGSTISNATCVRFDGAVADGGQARLLIAPWLANGTYDSLYGVGITTQDIPNGEEGFVTVFGKVRNINTTGAAVGETWQVGNILYANPNIAGGLTNIKPTSPNNVAPIAAVLIADASEGEIFVRPTIFPRLRYATFSDTTNQVATVANTPYAVKYNTTDIASGFRVQDTTKIVADVSGYYNYKFSIQLVSTNSSAKEVWIWFRKNGVDIPNSATRKTIVGNAVYDVAAWDVSLSMNANDYFEIMWAVSDPAVTIVAPAATAFCPAIPSIILNITEAAL